MVQAYKYLIICADFLLPSAQDYVLPYPAVLD